VKVDHWTLHPRPHHCTSLQQGCEKGLTEHWGSHGWIRPSDNDSNYYVLCPNPGPSTPALCPLRTLPSHRAGIALLTTPPPISSSCHLASFRPQPPPPTYSHQPPHIQKNRTAKQSFSCSFKGRPIRQKLNGCFAWSIFRSHHCITPVLLNPSSYPNKPLK
jgi:hypothetical protein